jgi:hypothetical protein
MLALRQIRRGHGHGPLQHDSVADKGNAAVVRHVERLNELADWLPEYKERIRNIRERLWDLWPFVKKHVYHPEFGGSFSIKSVLPALVPDLTYDGMEVADGGEAGLAWEQLTRGELDPVERERLKDALLAYCRQDTLAMVKILERLRGT